MMDNHSQISTAEIKIRFRDIDAMGHVNNAVYFTYMEVARAQFLSELAGIEDPLNLPVIIAEASCTFKKPARYGDTLLVKVEVTRIGDKSFELDYKMTDQKSKLFALGRTVMVAYDYTSHRSIRIPDSMRIALAKYCVS